MHKTNTLNSRSVVDTELKLVTVSIYIRCLLLKSPTEGKLHTFISSCHCISFFLALIYSCSVSLTYSSISINLKQPLTLITVNNGMHVYHYSKIRYIASEDSVAILETLTSWLYIKDLEINNTKSWSMVISNHQAIHRLKLRLLTLSKSWAVPYRFGTCMKTTTWLHSLVIIFIHPQRRAWSVLTIEEEGAELNGVKLYSIDNPNGIKMLQG